MINSKVIFKKGIVGADGHLTILAISLSQNQLEENIWGRNAHHKLNNNSLSNNFPIYA